MPTPTAIDTAYYLNTKIRVLALIGKGVPFPVGPWIRLADATGAPWNVEAIVPQLFPTLRGSVIEFAVLLTDFDVREFEKQTRVFY